MQQYTAKKKFFLMSTPSGSILHIKIPLFPNFHAFFRIWTPDLMYETNRLDYKLPQAGLFEPCVGLFEPSFETVVTPKSLLTSLYTQNQSITAFSLPAKNKYYQPMDRQTDRHTFLKSHGSRLKEWQTIEKTLSQKSYWLNYTLFQRQRGSDIQTEKTDKKTQKNRQTQ